MTLLFASTFVLAGCNSIPDYRGSVNYPAQSTENTVITPIQDYAEYQSATDLLILNYEPTNTEPKSKDGDIISVKYAGFLTDGSNFDSSPSISFTLGNAEVISGWDEGFKDKSVGDKFTLVIPASKGYGDIEKSAIPANSVLVFEVEVLNIQSAQ